MYTVIFRIHSRNENSLSDKLFSLGAQSLSTARESDGTIVITAIFDAIDNLSGHFPPGSMEIHELVDSKWKYTWLEHYHGSVINDEISVEPFAGSDTVSETASTRPYRILLDPRDAFGDGRHPTTVLCLKKIHAFLSPLSRDRKNSLHFLDVGTGTGILAILACLMGAGHIDAFDIETDAVTKTRSNCSLNECAGINVFQADISLHGGEQRYDLITANLLTGIIKPNLPALHGMLLPHGTLILSGISHIWHDEMVLCFTNNGLRVEDMETLEGWNCYVLRISP
jgi:ribosomal protein L11 methyltransferase